MLIKLRSLYAIKIGLLCLVLLSSCTQEVVEETKLWHKKTVSFKGPELVEEEATFMNYRLQVIFKNTTSNTTYNVPGFFAADGNAAQTGAERGTNWKAYFVPDELGEWTYTVSFRKGEAVAVSLDDNVGESAGFFDGATGKFNVVDSDIASSSSDFRGKGMLRYVGEHYLQYAGSKAYFLKGGAGSPENFLAYADFDGTYDHGGTDYPALGENQLHDYVPHKNDWKQNDPIWKDSLGTEIIGAVNYIADKGLNSVYLLTMNVEADGQDIWPWTAHTKRTVYDVSKLAQWDIVFDHMDQKGIMKDVLLTEPENENLFEAYDGGEFCNARKLYYREMIARFGHNLGLSWNLGEEIGHDGTGEMPYRKPNTNAQRKLFCEYIKAVDPYDHLLVAHIWTDDEEIIYKPLLGFSSFDGLSYQENKNYYTEVADWVKRSAEAGRKWVVAMDEPLGWEFGLKPDDEDPEHDIPRTEVLWPVLMANGSGVDWYFGWQNNAPTSDLSNEDWRSRNNMWEQTKVALDFFNDYLPFQKMKPKNELLENENQLLLAYKDELFTIYQKQRDSIVINLTNMNNSFDVSWYDPQNGGTLQQGTVTSVKGGEKVSLGNPPETRSKDWVCLVRANN